MLLPSHFISQMYGISEDKLQQEKILNINTIRDMPVFIDPFNLFYNDKYKELHNRIIQYILFLQSRSSERKQTDVELKAYYYMSEIKETWLGYKLKGAGAA